ncbi:MAG: hypothetical protein ACTJHT_10475 [Sphingobacterium sp.]
MTIRKYTDVSRLFIDTKDSINAVVKQKESVARLIAVMGEPGGLLPKVTIAILQTMTSDPKFCIHETGC